MEKIRVNMTPCEEVKTIHASQNDNATRKWAFDLYDENGKIDSSSIKEQMIFDSRVGGTEQILPENTSDPTTSPIIADIQYPDSLRSEQTFLYRESPTTVNGQSKVTRIKGNTVVFNQLAQNGNFANTAGWYAANGTLSASNNILTLTATADSAKQLRKDFSANEIKTKAHKYFILFYVYTSKTLSFDVRFVDTSYAFAYTSETKNTVANSWNKISIIADSISNDFRYMWTIFGVSENFKTGDEVQLKNYMFFDLTAMGIDNLTTTAQVEEWLSTHIGNLPYYDYTQGKLLPFKGESLKVTGKNLLPLSLAELKTINTNGTWNGDDYSLNGLIFNVQTEADKITNINVNGVASARVVFHITKSSQNADLYDGTYILSKGNTNSSFIYRLEVYNGSSWVSILATLTSTDNATFTYNHNGYDRYAIYCDISSGTTLNNVSLKPMIRYANVQDATFEPYTSSTINLPVLDYFPTGMKSAGNFYDEKTDSKAVARIKTKDLSELPWSYDSNGFFYTSGLDWDLPKIANSLIHPINCAKYYVANFSTSFPDNQWGSVADKTIAYHCASSVSISYIYIKDTSFNGNVANFTNALSGVAFYYATKTPTEESITTASLVTERGEAPLYYDDELIADCNETISAESGIFDAKIKLMDDETIYSQKIQLHVERKPQ